MVNFTQRHLNQWVTAELYFDGILLKLSARAAGTWSNSVWTSSIKCRPAILMNGARRTGPTTKPQSEAS